MTIAFALRKNWNHTLLVYVGLTVCRLAENIQLISIPKSISDFCNITLTGETSASGSSVICINFKFPADQLPSKVFIIR